MNKRIYLSPPHMGGDELKLVQETFESNWIAPLGPQVDAFEQEMATYLGGGYTAALSSGTAALHLALRIAGVAEGDKVLCSSLTFSASANAIRYEKAVPVFLDVLPESWTLDPLLLEKAIREHQPKAIISVDLYGQSCDYDTIEALCDTHGVYLIEDAAESLGADYHGRKCGTFGKLGILSFNGNKIITTSGGGMLYSNDERDVKRARFLASQAREPALHYEHRELGYNYRMSNILAAVGRGQLRVLDERVQARRDIFLNYVNALSAVEGIGFMPEAPYGRSNRWLTVITIDPEKTGVTGTEIIKALDAENIEARPVWKPMHLQPLYKGYEYFRSDREDVSKHLFENGLCLPSGSNLSSEEQERIIDIVLSIL